MKKTIIALSIITSAIIACSPKVSKTLTNDAATISATGNVTTGGLLISSAKCTKCHKDETGHVPKHTFEEQEQLMVAMAQKAKLSEQEATDLLSYVKANAKK